METGLLYLFTTIAQCLAGAIALLAAFALYRLQSIDNTKSDLCRQLIEVFEKIRTPDTSLEMPKEGLSVSIAKEGKMETFEFICSACVSQSLMVWYARGLRAELVPCFFVARDTNVRKVASGSLRSNSMFAARIGVLVGPPRNA